MLTLRHVCALPAAQRHGPGTSWFRLSERRSTMCWSCSSCLEAAARILSVRRHAALSLLVRGGRLVSADRDARNRGSASDWPIRVRGSQRLPRGWRLALAGRRTRRAGRRSIAAASRGVRLIGKAPRQQIASCAPSARRCRRSGDREVWSQRRSRRVPRTRWAAVTAMLRGCRCARAGRSPAANADRRREAPAPAPAHRGVGCGANRRWVSRASAAPGSHRRRRGAAPPPRSRTSGLTTLIGVSLAYATICSNTSANCSSYSSRVT